MRYLISTALLLLIMACQDGYNPKENLSVTGYQERLAQIAPYVIGKSDEFSYEERFLPSNKPFYDNFISLAKAELVYFKERDTASLFYFQYRDLTSLYEHYRGLGGYFRQDDNGKITFMNVLYHTPRLTAAEITERRKLLFEQMLKKGNVNTFLGNKQFIQTPNDDFYYNTKLNRWDYTENSSWKFLEEARQQAAGDSLH
jgi:hypothetical protein